MGGALQNSLFEFFVQATDLVFGELDLGDIAGRGKRPCHLSRFILQYPAPPGQQPFFTVAAPLPALHINDIFVTVENRFDRLIDFLFALEVVRRFVADDIGAEEFDPGMVGPGVHLVCIHLHDDVGNGLQQGLVAGGQGLQIQLGPFALADVIEGDDEAFLKKGGVQLANAYRAVAAADPVLAGIDRPAGCPCLFQERFPALDHVLPVLGVGVGDLVPLGCGCSGMSEEFDGAAAPIVDLVVLQIDHGDGERRRIQHQSELGFAFLQSQEHGLHLQPHPLAFADVDDSGDEMQRLASPDPGYGHADVGPDIRSVLVDVALVEA